jgi:AcrR family transcriptional regulator
MSETSRAVNVLRERRKELTRQALQEAALSAFAAHGYVSVSIDEIAQRAGTSRSTFYLHFSGKADILRALRDDHLAEWNLDFLVDFTSASRKELTAFFEYMVDFYSRAPLLHKTLHEARAADSDFAREYRRTLEGVLENWASSSQSKEVSEGQLRLVIAVLYSLIDHFLYLWLILGWELDRRDAVRAMTSAMIAIRKGPQ